MCKNCRPIDDQIMRYRLLSARIDDQQTLDAIRYLLEELEAKKRALHAVDQETSPRG